MGAGDEVASDVAVPGMAASARVGILCFVPEGNVGYGTPARKSLISFRAPSMLSFFMQAFIVPKT